MKYEMEIFCIKCGKKGKCKCEDKSSTFMYPYILRAPGAREGASAWRAFIKYSPAFVNCVPIELRGEFREFMKSIDLYDIKVGDFDWTYIHRDPELNKQWEEKYEKTEKVRVMFRKLLESERKKLDLYEKVMQVATLEELAEAFKNFRKGK